MKKSDILPFTFDRKELFEYLSQKKAPVMEAELLKFFSGKKRLPAGRKGLFEIHFCLYHALYKLKYHYGSEGYYLHLDSMRIRLLSVPGRGRCGLYLPEEGRFCGRTAAGSPYCDAHTGPYREEKAPLSFDPLRDFYLNPENITFGGSRLLERLMNGVMVYAFRQGEVKRALNFFVITYPTQKKIRKRYHELARQYHPDHISGDAALMKECNRNYQLLMEVFGT